jgi:hypothetical protein
MIEMKDGELLIDAGSNIIKLKGSRLEKEISPKPPELTETGAKALIGAAEAAVTLFKGDAIATILGASYEHFGGIKAETFAGGKFEASLAEALEIFLGAKQEISLAEALEIFLGAKQEICLGHVFELFAGAKHEMSFGTNFEYVQGVGFKKDDVVFEDKLVKFANEKLKIEDGALKVIN